MWSTCLKRFDQDKKHAVKSISASSGKEKISYYPPPPKKVITLAEELIKYYGAIISENND